MNNFVFPGGLLPQAAHFQTKQALLLVDLQNEFIKPEGKLFVSNVAGFLPNLPSLVSQFRSRGQVFWVRTEFEQPRSLISSTTRTHTVILKEFIQSQENEGLQVSPQLEVYPEDNGPSQTTPGLDPPPEDQSRNPEAFLTTTEVLNSAQCCLPGTDGCHFPEQIAAIVDSQHDTVVVKSNYSAFEGTSLLQEFRMGLVTKIYICGSLSNISVYATVLDAATHGLEVTIIEDCVGFRDEACHVKAMRQMADSMCAEGIDYQELMDDLTGLLGDVVKEEDFPTRFQVSFPRPSLKGTTRSPQLPSTMASVQLTDEDCLRRDTSTPEAESIRSSHDSLAKSDSSSRKSFQRQTPDPSPPRKRSTSGLELEEPEHKSAHKPSQRRASHEAYIAGVPKPRPRRVRVHKHRNKAAQDHIITRELGPLASPPMLQSQSSGDIPTTGETRPIVDNAVDLAPQAARSEKCVDPIFPSTAQLKKSAAPTSIPFGPGDSIGEGDSYILNDLLPTSLATDVFNKLKVEVRWQTMHHRSGEVPRLVAVQGDVFTSSDGSSRYHPIYRHPADESPELLCFTETVSEIRMLAERAVGQPLNHVLIQLYRSGEDNISEHSDKTLDITPGSKILNYSCGAMRTMTLRKKKSAVAGAETPEAQSTQSGEIPVPVRPTQRIPMPHNSLFVLGMASNQHWLHSIRADKRRAVEKSPAELDYGGERISLTFRRIWTYVDLKQQVIWGMGASIEGRDGAQKILEGPEAEKEGEKMIRAFGQENHLSHDWRWEDWYGNGFDVVNFTETKTEAIR